MIRDAFDAWLGPSGDTQRRERFERALAVVGKFSSGRHDITAEHDRELADIYDEDLRRKR